jgi:GDP-L-fucose synthase
MMSKANMIIDNYKHIYVGGHRRMAGSAILHVMDLPIANYQAHTSPMETHINVGTGVNLNVTIRELAHAIMDAVGYNSNLFFNAANSGGTPRRSLNVFTPAGMGWHAQVQLNDGLKQTYTDFLNGARA